MEFTNTLNNLTVDDQYFMELPVSQGPTNVPIGNVGLVVTASRGPIGSWLSCTSYTDYVKKYGEVDQAFTLTGAPCVREIFAQGNTTLYISRAQSSVNPALTAQIVLKDGTGATVMTLPAATPGTWGNGLNANVAAGTKTGTFKIALQYGSETETWDNLVIAQPATPIPGAVLASAVFGANPQSNLAGPAVFPATPNVNVPANGSYTMTGGTDGVTGIADTDYIGGVTNGVKSGLSVLDSAPINYIACAEQTSATINAAVIANAQNITAAGGLPRKAVFSFPRTTQPSQVGALMATYDSDRGYPCFLWQKIKDPISGQDQYVSPIGYFLGVLAQLKPHQSPGNKPIYGSNGTDPNVNIGPGDLTTLAQARVNVVGLPTPAGPVGVRGGFTASQTSGDSQKIYIRNLKDYIDQSVFSRSGVYVDQPITDDLMRHVKQTVDDVLYPMKNPNQPSDQMIKDYRIICDSSNNPDSQQQQDILICDYAVKALGMNRFMVFRTQIGSGVIITTTMQFAAS